jgi:hypothetical protein
MDIENRQTNRLRVMKAIFDLSGGSERQEVRGHQLVAEVGLSESDLRDACDYLAGQGLIQEVAMPGLGVSPVPHWVNITHQGIVEMQQSAQAPDKPTEHFPPISVVYVGGNAIGSTIQSGSPGAQQEVSLGDLNLDAVRNFLREFDAQKANLDLADAEEELAAEIATVRAQVGSPKPKRQTIRNSLSTIRAVLEGAGGNLAATGLLDLLQHIHF